MTTTDEKTTTFADLVMSRVMDVADVLAIGGEDASAHDAVDAIVTAHEERIAELTRDLDHMRHEAGPDSCADYAVRNREHAARIFELEGAEAEYIRRTDAHIESLANENESLRDRLAELEPYEKACERMRSAHGWKRDGREIDVLVAERIDEMEGYLRAAADHFSAYDICPMCDPCPARGPARTDSAGAWEGRGEQLHNPGCWVKEFGSVLANAQETEK